MTILHLIVSHVNVERNPCTYLSMVLGAIQAGVYGMEAGILNEVTRDLVPALARARTVSQIELLSEVQLMSWTHLCHSVP